MNEHAKEIRASNVEVHYANSCENPADVATRGQTTELLKTNELWWKGTIWICHPFNEWPSFNYKLSSEIQLEVKSEEKGEHVLFETALISTNLPAGPFGINENNFSLHAKLVRVTAWCMRFIINIKTQKLNSNFLTAYEISEASDLWFSML